MKNPLTIVIDRTASRMRRTDALCYTNAIRYALDLPPLRELRCGVKGKAMLCPIAESISEPGYQAVVEHNDVVVRIGTVGSLATERTRRKFHMPEEVTRFIEAFDDGRHPDLEVKP